MDEPGSDPSRGDTKPPRRRRRRRWLRRTLLALVLIPVLSIGAFAIWAQLSINHVDALSGAADTPGQTFLIVGSDSRDGWADDGTTGARTDTIMVLHRPETGPTALISIPRDSYVEIPGHGKNKINAAFAFGGPALLVETVEDLTGLTIDRYLEIGFAGVSDVVDALGGVELCYDKDVNDPHSTLVWTAGCHEADGTTALAFARMRYSDPIGDIGRTKRQQQLVEAVADKALRPSTLLNPIAVIRVTDAGLSSLRVSNGTSVLDLAQAALVFDSTLGDGAVTGTPPLVSLDHRVDGVGSTVLLDPDAIDEFWRRIAEGDYPPGPVGGWKSG
ncbi:MAG: LCP family protein [Demequinaceae bacterium]|nr:LCP family protein [Demequinaceae bacterium]